MVSISSQIQKTATANKKEDEIRTLYTIHYLKQVRFTNFNGFISAINKPNSIFYDNNGKYSVRVSGSVIVIVWDTDKYIRHITINNKGVCTYNTIQIVDQTLYRLSNLTIEPIVNPKIWIGTATQYAAIAQKDNNTTYIVKSDA